MTDPSPVVQVALHATDLDRATEFWTGVLGYRLIARFGPLVFVDLGGTRLLLEEGAPTSLIYLRVADVRETIERLRTVDVDVVSEPHVIFTDSDGVFGPAGLAEWHAFVRDSEENLVGLISHHRPAEQA